MIPRAELGAVYTKFTLSVKRQREQIQMHGYQTKTYCKYIGSSSAIGFYLQCNIPVLLSHLLVGLLHFGGNIAEKPGFKHPLIICSSNFFV